MSPSLTNQQSASSGASLGDIGQSFGTTFGDTIVGPGAKGRSQLSTPALVTAGIVVTVLVGIGLYLWLGKKKP